MTKDAYLRLVSQRYARLERICFDMGRHIYFELLGHSIDAAIDNRESDDQVLERLPELAF